MDGNNNTNKYNKTTILCYALKGNVKVYYFPLPPARKVIQFSSSE